MGLIQDTVSRMISAVQTTGELPDPEFAAHEIFNAIEKGDVDTVSRVLDQVGYDATALDEDGYTILHCALLGGNSQIVELVLQRGANDPAILNAKDFHGRTPLVLAASAKNLPVMQILLNAGAHVDDADVNEFLDRPGSSRGICDPDAVVAEILIRAKGDISDAFTLSVAYGSPIGAELYFSAGASSLGALNLGSRAIDRMSDWHCLRAEDVLARIEQVQRSGDDPEHPLLCEKAAFRVIYGMKGQSDESIGAVYQGFIAAGVDAEQLVSLAVKEYARFGNPGDFSHGADPHTSRSGYFHVLKSLIAIGAPTVHELVRQSQTDGNKALSESLVRLGADVLGAIPALNESDARRLAYVALRTVLEQHDVSKAHKADKLTAIVLAAGPGGAADLARDLTKNGSSLDDVKLLVSVGATISDELLLAVADRACHAEQQRAPEQISERTPEHRFLRHLVDARVDYSSMEKARDSQNAICRTIAEHYGDLASQEALNTIMYAQLQSLLSEPRLLIEDTVGLVNEMITQDAGPAAEKLLRDAVIRDHAATVKLLVSAGASATTILVELSRRLPSGELKSMERTEALVRLGANYQPALWQLNENVKTYTAAGDLVSAENEREAFHQLGFRVALVT